MKTLLKLLALRLWPDLNPQGLSVIVLLIFTMNTSLADDQLPAAANDPGRQILPFYKVSNFGYDSAFDYGFGQTYGLKPETMPNLTTSRLAGQYASGYLGLLLGTAIGKVSGFALGEFINILSKCGNDCFASSTKAGYIISGSYLTARGIQYVSRDWGQGGSFGLTWASAAASFLLHPAIYDPDAQFDNSVLDIAYSLLIPAAAVSVFNLTRYPTDIRGKYLKSNRPAYFPIFDFRTNKNSAKLSLIFPISL